MPVKVTTFMIHDTQSQQVAARVPQCCGVSLQNLRLSCCWTLTETDLDGWMPAELSDHLPVLSYKF